MITVQCDEDRWGEHYSYPPRHEERIIALGSLFEGDLWQAADIVDRSATRLVVRTSLLPHCTDTTTFEGSEDEMRGLVVVASHCLADSAKRSAAVRGAVEMLEESLNFYDADAKVPTQDGRWMLAEARMRAACLSMAGVTDADLFARGMRLRIQDLIAGIRLAAEGECSLDEAFT